MNVLVRVEDSVEASLLLAIVSVPDLIVEEGLGRSAVTSDPSFLVRRVEVDTLHIECATVTLEREKCNFKIWFTNTEGKCLSHLANSGNSTVVILHQREKSRK